jgi:hypothetical protein
VTGALGRYWETSDAVREQLVARSVEEVGRKAEARAKAVEGTAKLNAVPLSLRNAANLVVGKAALSKTVRSTVVNSKGEDMTNSDHLQHSVIQSGLKRWKDNRWAPTMRLHLTAKEMKDLGITEKKGELTGDVTKRMLALTGGVDLIRKRDVISPSLDELEARYLKKKQ